MASLEVQQSREKGCAQERELRAKQQVEKRVRESHSSDWTQGRVPHVRRHDQNIHYPGSRCGGTRTLSIDC